MFLESYPGALAYNELALSALTIKVGFRAKQGGTAGIHLVLFQGRDFFII